MKKIFKRKFKSTDNKTDYVNCVNDLIKHEKVIQMENYIQHGNVTCLEHCIHVSYYSYLICKKLKLNYKAAARAGLLHDLFLYDWHIVKQNNKLHGFTHPKVALNNAKKYFDLDNKESEIIRKHMWPMTIIPPKYLESYVVLMVDKYCAIKEYIKKKNTYKLKIISEI